MTSSPRGWNESVLDYRAMIEHEDSGQDVIGGRAFENIPTVLLDGRKPDLQEAGSFLD
jgi:hypothetical protein